MNINEIYDKINKIFIKFNTYNDFYNSGKYDILFSSFNLPELKEDFLKNLNDFIYKINKYKLYKINNDKRSFLLSFRLLEILNKIIKDKNYFNNNIFNNDKEYISHLSAIYSYISDFLINLILIISNFYNNADDILIYIKNLNYSSTSFDIYDHIFKSDILSRNRNILIEFMEDDRIKNNDKVKQALFMFIMDTD